MAVVVVVIMLVIMVMMMVMVVSMSMCMSTRTPCTAGMSPLLLTFLRIRTHTLPNPQTPLRLDTDHPANLDHFSERLTNIPLDVPLLGQD